MARRKIIVDEPTAQTKNTEPIVNISDMVDDYIDNKDQSDHFGKIASNLNKKIKEYLAEHKATECSGSKGSVVLQTRKSESFDEESLIQYLKDNGRESIVKTKEYVDYDLLESAIYNGNIAPEDLNPYRIVKETVALNIKREKGE